VDALVARGYFVYVVDSLISGTEEFLAPHVTAERAQFVRADIRDLNALMTLPAVDIVYHWAADPDVRSSVPNPMTSYDHNMNGTMNVLEYVRLKQVPQLMFASSGGTLYGDVEEFPISERAPLAPISPYGASKAAAEMYISAYANAYEFKAASVRYANIFGERSRHGVGYDFFIRLSEDPTRLTILGDGQQSKSYLHVSDTIEATLLVADQLPTQTKWYDFYNVGSEEMITVVQIAETFAEVLGLPGVTHEFTGGQKGWVGDVHKMLLDIRKIRAMGWSPKVSYREAVEHYVTWLRAAG
jgi:UDP-glucose 4-epimerase